MIPESEIKAHSRLREKRTVVGYARVSFLTQKDDLERQEQTIPSYVK